MKNTSRKPYIYKVTNLENHQYYIGSQCSGKTIGVNYFTSSTNKAFKDGFKNYREKYEITIIKEFTDPEECVRVENYIIRNYMQLKDGLCLNRFYCCNSEKIFSTLGLPAWNKGIPRSEETKQKISEAHKGQSPWNKGIPYSEETKKKISIAKKGTHPSEDARKKMSEALKGHPAWNKGIHHSEEVKQKIRANSPNRMKISIEEEVFDSIREASQYYNVGISTVRYWVKIGNHNAFYIEKCPEI